MESCGCWMMVLGCALVLSTDKVLWVHGTFINGDLLVKAGDNLVIDTSSLTAQYGSKNITLTSRNGTKSINKQNYTYHTAELKYKEGITFKKGSSISITGHRSLSIQSKGGDIHIETDINITCKRTTGSSRTCLGGYLVNPTMCTGGFYPGDGPGWFAKTCTSVSGDRGQCMPGATHGGVGGMYDRFTSDPDPPISKEYGRNDFQSMFGGSAGFSKSKDNNFGGGAIEIIARNGKIVIDALISASAVNENSAEVTGSSGGLIRLIAKEVQMKEKASLNVDGGNGVSGCVGTCNPGAYHSGNGAGSGGVIQIAAPKGVIKNLTLAGGKPFQCTYSSLKIADNGVVLIKAYVNNGSYIFDRQNKSVEFFKWPNETNEGHPINASKMDLDLASKQLAIIKEKFKDGISTEKVSQLLQHLYQLLNFSTGTNLTKQELLQFVQMFGNYSEIVNMLSHEVLPSETQEIFDVILKLAAVVMATNNHHNWKELKQLPYFVSTLEDMAVSISNSTSEYQSTSTDTIIIQSNRFIVDGQEGYKFPVHSKLSPKSFITKRDFFYLPKTSLSERSGEYRFVVLFFKDIQGGLPDQSLLSKESKQLFKVASLLMSCRLLRDGFPVTKLSSPAFLHFALNVEEKPQEEAIGHCSFWNLKNSSWESEGMSTKEFNSSQTVCTTTHFTSFAVLMQHTAISLTDSEKLSLLLITYIGCGISTGTLLIALIVFLSIEALSSDRHRIHLNLVIALLLAQILFLTGLKATEQEILCKVIAGALHYFYLASFTWMLIEGVHLYLKVVKVFGIENIKVKQYYIIGWGMPALIVGAAAIIKPYSYGTKYVCWLSLDDGFVWAFIGPVLAIIAINCFILAAVIKTVVVSASTMKSSDHSHIKAGLKGALVLMPLMGITWVFGLLAVNRDSLIFQYVFSIANSLQGFLIFLLHIVFNNEVQLAFKRQREKRQLSKESADYNASVSVTNDSDRNTWEKGTSSSNSSAKTGLSRLKARLSMSVMPKTSRVVSVQPINTIEDEEEVQVNRKYHHKTSSNERSAAPHCPSGIDLELKPPPHSPLKSEIKAYTRI